MKHVPQTPALLVDVPGALPKGSANLLIAQCHNITQCHNVCVTLLSVQTYNVNYSVPLLLTAFFVGYC